MDLGGSQYGLVLMDYHKISKRPVDHQRLAKNILRRQEAPGMGIC
jgi:hypothetical protein